MNLCLLQIADSALPISGYTHSWGLEAAIGRGLVHDPESLERWTRQWLRTSLGPLEGVLVASGCRAAHAGNQAGLWSLNALAEVSIMPPSIRCASREMGAQLLALGATWAWCRRGLAPFLLAGARGLAPLRCFRIARGSCPRRARGRAQRLPPPGGPGYDWRGSARDPGWPYARPTSAGLSPG